MPPSWVPGTHAPVPIHRHTYEHKKKKDKNKSLKKYFGQMRKESQKMNTSIIVSTFENIQNFPNGKSISSSRLCWETAHVQNRGGWNSNFPSSLNPIGSLCNFWFLTGYTQAEVQGQEKYFLKGEVELGVLLILLWLPVLEVVVMPLTVILRVAYIV